jgi:hypothetical protein
LVFGLNSLSGVQSMENKKEEIKKTLQKAKETYNMW